MFFTYFSACNRILTKCNIFMKQKICDLGELSELAAKEFTLEPCSGMKDAFLIYVNQKYYAYLNQCPHTGVNLNWQPEQFFSVDGGYLQCSMHGALFETTTGKCILGPCRGQNLKPVEITIEGGAIYLA